MYHKKYNLASGRNKFDWKAFIYYNKFIKLKEFFNGKNNEKVNFLKIF